jgi:outer membrane protein OmpA-like peptidoglycan-associated protein
MRDAPMRVAALREALAFGRPLLAGLLLLGAAGCTVLTPDETAQPPENGSAAAIPPASGNESFPNLGSVPDQAPAVPSATERQNVIEGLSADRANAHYTDQDLKGQPAGVSLAPPEPQPQPQTFSTESAPLAAPTEPVETVPAGSNDTGPTSEAPAVEAPAAETSSADAIPAPSEPAAAPLTPAGSAMTSPPPAAPAPDAVPPPPDPEPAAAADPAAPATAAMPGAPAATQTAESMPAAPAVTPAASPAMPSTSAALPLPGQPGTIVPPVSTAPTQPAAAPTPMPAGIPEPAQPGTVIPPPANPPAGSIAASAMPAQPAITATPLAPPPSLPVLPPATTVASVVPSVAYPYQSVYSRPASYSSEAVTVDMSAVEGGGAPDFYPAALASAYAPSPATYAPQATVAAYQPAPGVAGGPAGMIYFGEGAAGLDANDRAVLKSVAQIYRQRGGYIRLVGHASQDGGKAAGFAAQQANLDLSWARAKAVASQLVRDGVSPGAIETAGAGDSQPLYVESTAAAEAGNRRVEIYFVY